MVSDIRAKSFLTAITIEASNEKQKPISVHVVLNLAGLSLPSRSMRACMLSPSAPPLSRAIQSACAQALKHSSWPALLHLHLPDCQASGSIRDRLHCMVVHQVYLWSYPSVEVKGNLNTTSVNFYPTKSGETFPELEVRTRSNGLEPSSVVLVTS